MEQRDRDGAIRSAINTIKHGPRQSYGLIWVSFVQIIDHDLALLLAFGYVATRSPRRDRCLRRAFRLNHSTPQRLNPQLAVFRLGFLGLISALTFLSQATQARQFIVNQRDPS